MKITVLIENTSENPDLISEHGLSLLVETKKNTILIDTGQSDSFIKNANELGLNLDTVDYLILSHGHYDHCGGVMAFSKINPEAHIYISKYAFDEYWNISSKKYIGIDKRIDTLQHLHKVDSDYPIEDNIEVFSSVNSSNKFFPFENKKLMVKHGEYFVPDVFNHEQYAVITENNKKILFSGCAHNGIVNIMEKFVEKYGEAPFAVITGFHLMKEYEYNNIENDFIARTAFELKKYPTYFYSGHCTGKAFDIMKDILKNNLYSLNTGLTIDIN